MFDLLTKSKFHSKCKSLLRMTRTRVEEFKRKKKTVVKFLKNDMAHLLKAGLDYNAYGRAEGLLVELNVLACYDFIEQFCGCITSNLSVMNKQKGCPEECKEAIQSLIYAAARFAEFPELRDLRSLFVDRYGTSLELFINKEFVEKLEREPATKDAKIQLILDIANEFSVQWSPVSLEQTLFTPHEVQPHAFPERDVVADNNIDDERKKTEDDVAPKFSSWDIDDDRLKWETMKDDAYTREESYEAGIEVNDKEEHIVQSKNQKEHRFFAIKKPKDGWYNLPSNSENEASSRHTRDSSDPESLRASSSSMASVSEDEEDSHKKNFSYRIIPPPYLKPKVDKQVNKVEVPLNLADNIGAERVIQPDDAGETKPKPISIRSRRLRPPPDIGDHGVESLLTLPPGCPGHEEVGIAEILAGSRKPSVGKQEGNSQSRRVFQADSADQGSAGETSNLKPHQRYLFSWDDSDKANEEMARRNAKSELRSLPGEAPEEPVNAMKGHGRAFSLQPETLRGHVHPNLPDYDELAARIAAFRGR